MEDKSFVDYMLLRGYALNNFSLMYGIVRVVIDIIGGTKVTSIRINGGYLISYNYENEELGKLTAYQPDGGGQSIIFNGVTSSSSAPDGSGFQLGGVVRGSLWGRIKDTPYYDIPSEKDASNRGNDYMNTYYPNSGYKAP